MRYNHGGFAPERSDVAADQPRGIAQVEEIINQVMAETPSSARLTDETIYGQLWRHDGQQHQGKSQISDPRSGQAAITVPLFDLDKALGMDIKKV